MITFFPVVERELRIAARNKWTHWTRLGAACLAFGIACFMFLFWLAANTGGRGLFATLSFFGFVFCLVDGIRTTADCISEEKREGTLGLLFLTDLSGVDVVLGKLSSTALRSFYGVLSTFPILSLTVLMGGVTAAEFWGMIAALTVILFLSQSAAIFASTICWHERHAVSMSIGLLTGLAFVPLIPSWIGLVAGSASPRHFDAISPYRLCSLAFSGGFTNGAFRASLMINLALAICFLALACWFVRRRWQHQPGLSAAILTPPAQASGTNAWRTKRLEVNPVTWSLLRRRHLGEWGRPIIFGLVSLATLMIQPDSLFPVALVTAWTVNFLLKIRLAMQAARFGAELREAGRLELLMTTPLGHKEILRGLKSSVHEIFFKPGVALLLVEFGVILAGAFLTGSQGDNTLALMVVTIGAIYVLALLLDFYAAAGTGLWFGFSMGKPARATVRTIVVLQILPIFLVIVPFFGLFAGLIINAVFLGLSQSWLNARFLAIATGQDNILFGPVPPVQLTSEGVGAPVAPSPLR